LVLLDLLCHGFHSRSSRKATAICFAASWSNPTARKPGSQYLQGRLSTTAPELATSLQSQIRRSCW
jgi:hypothetical protein